MRLPRYQNIWKAKGTFSNFNWQERWRGEELREKNWGRRDEERYKLKRKNRSVRQKENGKM